jgi:glutathione S-transferase
VITNDDRAIPVLWHLKVSNYNEKARWVLDFKRVPHIRRAVVPGRHNRIAKRLAGSGTFPVMVLGGQAIGDSTQIIEALERRFPVPPLYPADGAEQRHALELEDFFDEELGPYVRLLLVHSILPNPRLTLLTFVPDGSTFQYYRARAVYPLIRRRFIEYMSITPSAVERAYDKVRAAGQRFQRELEPSGYLVGDRFSVADLTLASLVAPAVAPEQFPYPQPQRGHPLVAPLRDALSEYGISEWTKEIYARHRGATAEIRGHKSQRRTRAL